MIQMTDLQQKQLIGHYGKDNVENALIFLSGTRDPKGLHVRIEPTYELVREILDAVHRDVLGMIGDPSRVRI